MRTGSCQQTLLQSERTLTICVFFETARTPPDADAFGVARLEEAPSACAQGDHANRFCCSRLFLRLQTLPTIADQHLHTAVHNEEQLSALETAELSEPVTVWMKPTRACTVWVYVRNTRRRFISVSCQCKNVPPAGKYCQPFAGADEPDCGATEQQLDIFNTFCEGKPGMRSRGLSGILLWPQSHFDWARPGIILYGVSPLENRPWGPDFGFQPVMSPRV